VVEEARALILGPRLPELQRLAANSAGLTRNVGQMLRIQAWLLRQAGNRGVPASIAIASARRAIRWLDARSGSRK
jgi:hypothetical protein